MSRKKSSVSGVSFATTQHYWVVVGSITKNARHLSGGVSFAATQYYWVVVDLSPKRSTSFGWRHGCTSTQLGSNCVANTPTYLGARHTFGLCLTVLFFFLILKTNVWCVKCVFNKISIFRNQITHRQKCHQKQARDDQICHVGNHIASIETSSSGLK